MMLFDSNKLDEIMEQKGVTIARLAECLDISISRAYQFKKKKEIWASTAFRISDALDCNVYDLFTDDMDERVTAANANNENN